MSARIDLMRTNHTVMTYNLDFVDLNLNSIINEVLCFYRLLTFRSYALSNKRKRDIRTVQCIKNILTARYHFDNCLAILKSNFELESNKLIQDINKKYHSFNSFITYLGIANARLDELNEKLPQIERVSDLFRSGLSSISATWIDIYRNTLITFMTTLVLNPINHSVFKFINLNEERTIMGEDGKEVTQRIIKSKDLFYYMLFCEVYRASETEGAVSRQMALSGKLSSALKSGESLTVSSRPPSFHEQAQYENISLDSQSENKVNVEDLFGSGEEHVDSQ